MNKYIVNNVMLVLLVAVVFGLAGCGGGGGSSSGSTDNNAGSTYSVSGSVNLNGVALAGVRVSTGSAYGTTDSSGKYIINSLANGTHTITATLQGYTFTPANQTVTVSSANVTSRDFIATTTLATNFSISGTVTSGGIGMPGVTVALSGSGSAATTTDSSGNYIFITLANGSYSVTPTHLGETFTPANQSVTLNSTNITGINFTTTSYSTGMAVSTLAGSAGSSGSADGTGSAAKFSSPEGLTSDGTNLYVADGNKIRKVEIASGVVTTLAGSNTQGHADGTGSAASFFSTSGVTSDGTNLYVTDSANQTIRKVVIATGEVTTFAGSAGSSGSTDGTGPNARFNYPGGITTDGTNLYVTDSGNKTIRKVVIIADGVFQTKTATTLAGIAGSAGSADGTGSAARFNVPYGITTDNGTNLYVTDINSHTIRKVVVATGLVTTVAGSAGYAGSTDGTGSVARFNGPSGITTDGTNLYVTDYYGRTLRKIVIATGLVSTIAGSTGSAGSTDGTGSEARFSGPGELTLVGSKLYVCDGVTIRVVQ